MEKLHKEPDARRQDYHAFVNELKLFHQSRGTPFRHVPRINGRELDLQKFYNHVTGLGGLQKVIDQQKWESVIELLNIPKGCVNSALTLRQIYIRYLGHYEKIHFMGEEPDHDKNQSSESLARKLQMSLFQSVPMSYNSLQHEISDIARTNTGLNQVFVAPTDYDKLCMSLLSGLPNEQELALNVCTILSNEGNYMLHLEQAPKLVNLLVAQTGVWPQDDESLKMLYLESWKDLVGRNMAWFWKSTLDLQNHQLLQLMGYDLGEHDEDASFLHLRADLGSLNSEGQRVLRVLLILHNLSFERNNVPVLVSNNAFIRFLLLCIHSSWSNLKQAAFDTLSNLASVMKLSVEKDICSRIMFQSVMEGIQSADRFLNIRSMDILAQLCNCDANEDIIPSRLDVEIYHRLVSFLTVHDILLLFYTLEALYALSELGRYACDKIVCVHRSVGALVSLLTLEPNQYGPSGQMTMKIVETLVPVESDGEQEDQVASEDRCSSSPLSNGIASGSEIDSETVACNWLRSTYEAFPAAVVSRNEVYAEYVSFCGRAGRKGVVNATVFANCIKTVFPQCGLKKVESVSGIITFHHEGIKRKKITSAQTGPPISITNNHIRRAPITPPLTPCKPGQKLSNSPILKAQLSAPPRSGVTSPPLKQQSSSNDGIFLPSPTTPPPPPSLTPPAQTTPTGSSTLIKSLLANKVQQRNLQRQIVPQNVSKMVIYTPEKVTSFSQGVVGSPTAVVRCVRPGIFAQTNIGGQIRPSVQACIIPNKNRVIAATPPRVIKSTPLLSPKIQPKLLKPAVVANAVTTPRLNGVQRDVQMEVCNQPEDSNSIGGNKMNSFIQAKCVQNHVPVNAFSDSNDSFVADGEFLLTKNTNMTNECEKHFSSNHENSLSCRLSGSSELSVPSGNVVRSKSSNDVLLGSKEQNNSVITFVNNTAVTGFSVMTQPLIQPKTISSSSSILKSVLGELDTKNDELHRQQFQRDKISKRAPLLNGLLDKGKLPLPGEIQSATPSQNGDKLNSSEFCNEENKSTHAMQSTLNSTITSVANLNSFIPSSLSSVVIPASSLNSVIISASSLNSSIIPASSLNSSIVSSSPLNSVIVPASSLNSVIIPASSLNSVIVPASSLNSTIASASSLNSTIVPASVLNSAIVSASSLNSIVPATSLNSAISPSSSLNATIIPASSLNSAIISAPSLNSTIPTSSQNSVVYVSSSNVEQNPTMNRSTSTVIPAPSFHSNGDNLMQICTGQTTLSGTIEVQQDQKGVVRLHIESPENSNHGSDLSSISEIARTLECASKAISKTNAECNSHVPYSATTTSSSSTNTSSSSNSITSSNCETTATVTVITTNTSTLARTGQQIIVVTPALSQPQLHIQSPNIKFRILHSIPKVEESVETVGFSKANNQINQLCPASESSCITSASLKRPSSDTQSVCSSPDIKKPRIDTKTPLLEATLRLPTPVPCSSSTNVNVKSFQENQSFLSKSPSIETIGSASKLTTAKAVAVPVQNIDFVTEKEGKTFSGLSSAGDNPSVALSPQIPSKSCSTIEYICEWKDCGQKFKNAGSVFLHASKVHAPFCNDDMICQWEGCDNLKRRRFSLLTHLQDWHCNERVLHTQALRRKQVSQQGKSSIPPPQTPPPHPGYAPDAALYAVRRHALQYLNPKELSEEKESALTKSIRLTSALILRNLVMHSSLARSHVRRFEQELAYLAMSPVESARTIAQCLSHIISSPHD